MGISTAPILYIGCEQGLLDHCSAKDKGLQRFIDVASASPTLLIISTTPSDLPSASLSYSECQSADTDFIERILQQENCQYTLDEMPSTHATNLAKRLTLTHGTKLIELTLSATLSPPCIESISNNIRHNAPADIFVVYLDEYCRHPAMSSTSDEHLMHTRKTLRQWADCLPSSKELSADVFSLFSAFACAKFAQPNRYFSMRYNDTQNLHGFAWPREHWASAIVHL